MENTEKKYEVLFGLADVNNAQHEFELVKHTDGETILYIWKLEKTAGERLEVVHVKGKVMQTANQVAEMPKPQPVEKEHPNWQNPEACKCAVAGIRSGLYLNRKDASAKLGISYGFLKAYVKDNGIALSIHLPERKHRKSRSISPKTIADVQRLRWVGKRARQIAGFCICGKYTTPEQKLAFSNAFKQANVEWKSGMRT